MRGPLYIVEPMERRLLLTGVTMIVHGFNSSITGWVTTMGTAISNADSTPASVYSIVAHDDGGSGTIIVDTPTLLSGPQPNAATNTDPEIVLLLNWSSMAGNLTGGHTRSTGDVAAAVAARMIDPTYLAALGGTALAGLPMQLIGHSRGASLVNELARDLGKSGVWLDQLTLLDSHPVDGINEDISGFDFGDAAMGVPENTIFSDSYWRADSSTFDFNGEAVAGAHNSNLSESLLTGTAGDRLIGHDSNDPGYDFEHSDTHLWYHGTIPPYSNTDGSMTISPVSAFYGSPQPDRTTSGYYYSHNVGGARPVDGLWSNDGGTAIQQAVTRTGTQWPNIDHLSLRYDASGTLSTAGQLFLSYRYQDFDSGDTLTLFADADHNPYNSNGIALADTQSLATTGAALKYSLYHGSLAGVPASDHFLYAKITDPNGQTRFMYLPQTLSFTGSAPVTNATSGTPNNGSTDATDFDVYAINANYGGRLSVTMTAPATPLRSRIDLFSPTGASLGSSTASSDGGAANLSATALATGVFYVVASSGDGDAGAYSLTIHVDPPISASNPAFDDARSPQKFTVDFSANVGASLAASDLSVQLLPSGTPFHPQSASFAGSTGTFAFNGVLADGNYRVTLPAGSADDGAGGHLLGADLTADFFVLSADGDHSRVVGIEDFNLLAQNFGKLNQTFTQGNYDYSADGKVTILDFNLLAANFGKHLAAPAPAAPQTVQARSSLPLTGFVSVVPAIDPEKMGLLESAGLV